MLPTRKYRIEAQSKSKPGFQTQITQKKLHNELHLRSRMQVASDFVETYLTTMALVTVER